MDSDVCDFDVDEDQHLPLPHAHTGQQEVYSTSAGRHRYPCGFECHPHYSMDPAMYSDIGSLGSGVGGTEPVLLARPTTKSHLRTSQ